MTLSVHMEIGDSNLCRPARLRPPRLLRRPPESLPARKGRAARSHRRGVRAAGPGRSPDDRAPGRGARATARHRGRQEPAHRLSPRRQHPARRGKEGRRGRFRRAGTIRLCSRCRPKRRSPTLSPRRARRRASGRAARISRARCGRLAALRAPVDAFFLDVTVNADDPDMRLNRLRLLSELREAMHGVADFSKVAG